MERKCTDCKWNDWDHEPPDGKSCLTCWDSWEPTDEARERIEAERIERRGW